MSTLQGTRSQRNILLMKNEVGKAKSPVRTLPALEHTYGKSAGKDAYGAKDVLNGWSYHSPSSESKCYTDFKKLNKMTLKESALTSKEVSDFRKNNDAKIPKQRGGDRSFKISLPMEEFRYGIQNKPSTPMDQVVSFEYAHRAVEMNRKIAEVKQREKDEKRNLESSPKQTKSFKLLTESAVKKLESPHIAAAKVPFKMNKFKDVSPRVNFPSNAKKISNPTEQASVDNGSSVINIQVA